MWSNKLGIVGRVLKLSMTAVHDLMVHVTVSHRNGRIASCKNRFPCVRFARVRSCFACLRHFATSSMRSVGRSRKRNGM